MAAAAAAPSSYPSPPSSRAASPSPDGRQEAEDGQGGSKSARESSTKDTTLSAQLDALLESYLELLDIYTTLRAQLSTDFSSGFLSLAQANRSSTLGPGRRYGEEGFDERMKASRILQIRCGRDGTHRMTQNSSTRRPVNQVAEQPTDLEENQHHNPITSMHKMQKHTENDSRDQVSHGQQDQTDPASSLTQLLSHNVPSQTLTYTITSVPSSTEDGSDKDASSSKTKPLDPLRWYGILIPAHLRQCQSRFTASVTSTIPDLISTMSSMTALEQDIRSLRQEMGTLDDATDTDVRRSINTS